MSQAQCTTSYLGLVEYGTALELQRSLVERRRADAIGDQLLLLEHPHVITVGRRGSDEDILVSPALLQEWGVSVHKVDRGGQVTYHGPGQLVGYPIISLREWGGPVTYVRTVEEVILRTVAAYGVRGHRVAGHPGVWVDGAKLGAIGVRISRGVASHGFALNVSPDLEFFNSVVPCGTPGLQVTSLECLNGEDPPLEEVAWRVGQEFGALFGREIVWQAGPQARQWCRLHGELPYAAPLEAGFGAGPTLGGGPPGRQQSGAGEHYGGLPASPGARRRRH